MRRIASLGLVAAAILSLASLAAEAAEPSGSSVQPAPSGTGTALGGSSSPSSALARWGAPVDTASSRDGATLVALADGAALATGGYFANGKPSAGTDRYDPVTNTWTAVARMPAPGAQQTATTLRDGSVLFTGGYEGPNSLTGGGTDSAILYLPSGKWVSAGHMSVPREGHTALLLADGRVLVLGGYGGSALTIGEAPPPLATAEIFDPTTRSWKQPFSLPEPIEQFTATLLESGKVLLAGGYVANRGSVVDSWLYDPGTGTWSKAHPLLESRSSAIATRLANGKVLVIGGVRLPANATPGIFSSLTSGELYDPVSDSWSRLSTAPPIATNGAASAVLLNDGRVLLLLRGPSATPTSPLVAEFYDPTVDRWNAGPSVISASSAFGIEAVRLSTGRVLVMLSNESVLFDPGGTSALPAAAAPLQQAENPLNSARTTPYLVVSALFFLLIVLVRYARARIASRPGYR
ncbi:MAG TPA: kelch repeat-containing protein [Candidatus Dormibacteraeota bacterium]|nr:kelch repeat-containing protein [Candidatus Dormibacteraeota bacterium]